MKSGVIAEARFTCLSTSTQVSTCLAPPSARSALAQLVERAALLVGGAVEIRPAKRVLGVAHGFAGFRELLGRVRAFDAESVDQALQRVAQLTLAPAEIVEFAARALALRLLARLLAVAAGFPLRAFVATRALAVVRAIL